MPSKPLDPEDLAHVLAQTRDVFLTLAGANIFLTGGTGFFGHWLLESLLYANRELSLGVRATVLTRNAAAFRQKSPHIANAPAITLLEGDVRSFAFPHGEYTHILHAATDSGGSQTTRSAADLHNDILDGTRRVLAFARHSGAARLLYASTGAVYGRSTTLLHTPETYLETHAPALPPHSYEDAKRRAELLCLESPAPLEPVIARCFAFVGPHLPLDSHFAIGNFIGAAIAGQPIHIKGDGTPRRSWLYMADLSIWLWTMLARGRANRAYNVGSDEAYTIAEAARLVAATLCSRPTQTLSSRPEPSRRNASLTLSSRPEPSRLNASLTLSSRPEPSRLCEGGVERPAGNPGDDLQSSILPVHIAGTPDPAAPLNSYVPDITRARTELGLEVTIPLAEALRRTAAWYR